MNIPQPTLKRRTFLAGLLAVVAAAVVKPSTLVTEEAIEKAILKLPEPIRNTTALIIHPGYDLPIITIDNIASVPFEVPYQSLILHNHEFSMPSFYSAQFHVEMDGESEGAQLVRRWMELMVTGMRGIRAELMRDYAGHAILGDAANPLLKVEGIFPQSYQFTGLNNQMTATFSFSYVEQKVLT